VNAPSAPRSAAQLLTLVSAVMLPLGLLVIVLGWYGAAHTPYLFEQVPYLISGGLLGLGIVMSAGLVYFASWVARGSAAQEDAAQQQLALLQEIRDQLATRPASNGSRPRVGGSAFVATARGSMWHRVDCAVVQGREDLHAVGPDGGGLQPCALCDPLASPSLTN
jgi:hypothetical protein